MKLDVIGSWLVAHAVAWQWTRVVLVRRAFGRWNAAAALLAAIASCERSWEKPPSRLESDVRLHVAPTIAHSPARAIISMEDLFHVKVTREYWLECGASDLTGCRWGYCLLAGCRASQVRVTTAAGRAATSACGLYGGGLISRADYYWWGVAAVI